MLLTRSLLLFLLLTTLLLATEADARRRRRLKRQHDQGDEDDLRSARRARRRQHQRRRRGKGGSSDQQNPNVTLYTPVRHHDPSMEGIPVGEALSSQRCPPPVKPFFSELCIASACLHHHHCPPSTSCCFNGCVHTCLSQISSPPVIDWLEDTSAILPILEESAPPELPIRYEEADLVFAEGGGEAVHLPGGCTISGTQYSQLQDFMKAPSIDSCMCSQGEVVCAVKVFKS